MQDFFVSYNSADKPWAEWIAWQLEDAGHATAIQAWDFGPGRNFTLAMQQAAATAKHTIAVLSPDYLASRFTAPEWAAAFAQDPTGAKRRPIPARAACRANRPAGSISTCRAVSEAEAKARLLAGVAKERAKPRAKPEFHP